jgi:hypothetical protein
MLIQGQVGAPAGSNAPGATPAIRQGQLGDLVVSELHGRFYEQAYRNNMFFYGHTAPFALTANTVSNGASTTPILGIWNPPTSTVNAVVLQMALQNGINTGTSPATPGCFVWAIATGQNNLTAGATPFNAKTFQQTGSQIKAFNGATALTGLNTTGAGIVAVEAADIPVVVPSSYSVGTLTNTAIVPPTVGGVQNFDGGLIVAPGNLLVLLNTTSTTTISVFGRLLWEEVPL